MKNALLASAALLGLAACSPNYPAAQTQTGICHNQNCKIGDKASMDFYSKFMVGVVGDCTKQSDMYFTSMVAQYVLPKENAGFAEIHVYVDPATGKYTAAYAAPTQGTDAPAVTKFEGTFYLENDKMVLSDFGLAHKSTEDEVIVQPSSSSKIDMTFPTPISFVQDKSPVNEQGQTIAQYCAAQQQQK